MSYFEPSKYTTSGASFIEAQRYRLSDLIKNAKSIAVVGVQVREQDKHIWQALASTSARIFYWSGSQGANAYRNRASRINGNRRKHDIVSENYWYDNFDPINEHVGII